MTHNGTLIEHIARWLEYRVWATNIPGLQAAVWFNGRVIANLAIGHHDVEASTPLTTTHRFRVASHSKMLTAVAVLQLRESGELDLDDEVTTWIPELVDSAGSAGVTIRHLLTHRAGLLRDGSDADYWQFMHEFPTVRELIEIARQAFGVAHIGSQYKYSNIGYGLLGVIIERASGLGYVDYMQLNVVDRLGLTRTGADYDPNSTEQMAFAYSSDNLSWSRSRVSERVQTRGLASATGFFSTAGEMVAIAAALFGEDRTLLNDESRALLISSQEDTDDPGSEVVTYGYGVRTLLVDDVKMYGHGGNYPGHTSQTLWDTETGVGVSVIANAIEPAAVGICKGVLALMRRGVRHDQPEDPDLERFTGRFASIWDVVDIFALDGRLTMVWPVNNDPLEGAITLTRTGEATFDFPKVRGSFGTGESVDFTWTDNGEVQSIRVAGTTFEPVRNVSAAARSDVWPAARPHDAPLTKN